MIRDPKEFRERFQRWKAGKQVYKDGLPAYEDGEEDSDLGFTGSYIGAAPFIEAQSRAQIQKNKKIDSRIANKPSYGWNSIYRTGILNTPAGAKRTISPAWGIIDFNAFGTLFGATADKRSATRDDNAFFERHLGFPRDTISMPIRGIRFSGDYNDDGSLRLPNAEYTGVSDKAKSFIREGIKNGNIIVPRDGNWKVVNERNGYGRYTSHLGNYSIRENNKSGIYDIFDTYDFPWYNPVFNRQKGYQIEIRDTIHGPNAKPILYNPRFSVKNRNKNK